MSTHKQQQKQSNSKLYKLFWFIPSVVIGIILIVVIFNSTMHTSSTGAHNQTIASEEQFIVEMIAHHQEAVDSARFIAGTTTNSGIKQLTDTMVIVQSSEIDQLKAWKEKWYGRSWYSATYKNMMPDLKRLNGTAQELAFLNGMIVHHEMAIMMAQQVLTQKPHAEVRAFAENIIAAQSQEITLMKRIAGSLV